VASGVKWPSPARGFISLRGPYWLQGTLTAGIIRTWATQPDGPGILVGRERGNVRNLLAIPEKKGCKIDARRFGRSRDFCPHQRLNELTNGNKITYEMEGPLPSQHRHQGAGKNTNYSASRCESNHCLGCSKIKHSPICDQVCSLRDQHCSFNEQVCSLRDQRCSFSDQVCSLRDKRCSFSDQVCSSRDQVCSFSDQPCSPRDPICSFRNQRCSLADSRCSLRDQPCSLSDLICSSTDPTCSAVKQICSRAVQHGSFRNSICLSTEQYDSLTSKVTRKDFRWGKSAVLSCRPTSMRWTGLANLFRRRSATSSTAPALRQL
jgi:hypothetical protein